MQCYNAPEPTRDDPTAVPASIQRTVHRSDTGRSFAGIPIHAAGGLHEYVLALVERMLEPRARILDIGAGSGALSERLIAAGFDVVASDIDGADYRPSALMVEWDASSPNLPPQLPAGSFDAVCVLETLEHVENPLQALRNFRLLLKPDGLLIASTPNVGHPKSRLKFLLTGSMSYFGKVEYYATGHRTVLPDWLLQRHLDQTGYEGIHVSYAGQLGHSGITRIVWLIVRPMLWFLHPSPRTDDGCVTVATARKPRDQQPS